MRRFASGATRDDVNGKRQFLGYIDPAVLTAFGDYMLKHQTQADGSIRASDNWRKGIPREQYMDSGLRHIIELWGLYDEQKRAEDGDGFYESDRFSENYDEQLEAACAAMFNIMGYISQLVRGDVGE